MPKYIRSVVFSMALFPLSFQVSADASAEDVLKQTANLECADFCVIGTCFWLVCKLFSCDVETTLKIAHNRPDVTVSTHAQPGDSAWEEDAALWGSISYGAGAGVSSGGFLYGGGEDKIESSTLPVLFRDAHIVGSVYASVEDDSMMCDSPVSPMKPYLLTEVDTWSWRGVVERLLPQSYMLGMNEIGNWPSYTWGGVYPRIGWTSHTDPGKASAVVAVRAMDIVLNGGFHLYTQFEKDTNQAGWQMINNPTPWQQIYPTEKSSCEAIGDNNSIEWTNNIATEDGKTAWIYWPRCKCCIENSGVYLGSVEFGGGLCTSN